MKRTPLSKRSKKQTERKRLHAKAWKLMSQYVRMRDKACVTCGSTGTPQAGHFIHNKLDFNFKNINRQCSGCNNYKNGNLVKYAIYLQKLYGYDVIEELEIESNIVKKLSIEDYEAIINNLEYLLCSTTQNGDRKT